MPRPSSIYKLAASHLRGEIARFRVEVAQQSAQLRTEMAAQGAQLRTEIAQIAARFRLLYRMVGFELALSAAILAKKAAADSLSEAIGSSRVRPI